MDVVSDTKVQQKTPEEWIVGFTGASGIRYGLRLVEHLIPFVKTIHLVVSDAALRVLADEENIKISRASLSAESLGLGNPEKIQFHSIQNIGASIASGTAPVKGMVICPCSMGSLAAISHGISTNLIQRAADVTLKERRPLILVPRETPFSAIHLENMLRLHNAGATIVPAMPGFYTGPETIEDLVSLMVLKILDQMGLQSDLVQRWTGKAPDREEGQ